MPLIFQQIMKNIFLLKTTFCGSHYFKVILELGFIQGKTILFIFYSYTCFIFPVKARENQASAVNRLSLSMDLNKIFLFVGMMIQAPLFPFTRYTLYIHHILILSIRSVAYQRCDKQSLLTLFFCLALFALILVSLIL